MLFSLHHPAFACKIREQQNQQDSNSQKRSPYSTRDKKKNIVFFGNSLTAGYGLDPGEAFPALIQARIDSLGLSYQVINAGLSGETTAGGLSRIDWILRQPVEIFVLELGGNDGLRGIQPSATYQNLQSIINQVKSKYPEATILGDRFLPIWEGYSTFR
jgi:acyl-CoA thioesterase-1